MIEQSPTTANVFYDYEGNPLYTQPAVNSSVNTPAERDPKLHTNPLSTEIDFDSVLDQFKNSSYQTISNGSITEVTFDDLTMDDLCPKKDRHNPYE